MSTNLQHSNTKEHRTIAGVGVAEERTFSRNENILQTYTLKLTMSKSKESLPPRIDALWTIFCEQVQKSISDSSSKETTGQRQDTLSGIQTGLSGMAAGGTSGSSCLIPGCLYKGIGHWHSDPLAHTGQTFCAN